MKKKTTKEFIEESIKIHGKKYDYINTNYVNIKTKVDIFCKIHGNFSQTAESHLNGMGCRKCGGINIGKKLIKSKEWFIDKAKQTHGEKYDYTNIIYNGIKNDIEIYCNEHEIFFKQRPEHHINGSQCPLCCRDKMRIRFSHNKEIFETNSRQIHGNKYDYSLVNYVNANTKVKIKCIKHNYVFEQTPGNHLSGKGCTICNESHLERDIRNVLNKYKIKFLPQYRDNWLGNQTLDFYLPKHKIGIECQGIQHFEQVEYFGGEDKFKRGVELDILKRNLCNDNNIKLIYYSDIINDNYFEKIHNNKKDIIKIILNENE